MAIEGHNVTGEITDGDDKLHKLVHSQAHQFLAALLIIPIAMTSPDSPATVKVDQEVVTEEQVGGGVRGDRAHADSDEEHMELADHVLAQQLHRGNGLVGASPA